MLSIKGRRGSKSPKVIQVFSCSSMGNGASLRQAFSLGKGKGNISWGGLGFGYHDIWRHNMRKRDRYEMVVVTMLSKMITSTHLEE